MDRRYTGIISLINCHTATYRVDLIPSGGALGAEIRGLDLRLPLDATTVRRLRGALLDHCVLVLRDQAISEEDQVRFTGYFGRPVEHVRRQPDRPVKEIFLISNIEENGQPIGALVVIQDERVGFRCIA